MKSSLVCTTLAAFVLGLTLSASAHDVILPAGTLLQCTLNEPNFSEATAAVGDPVLCHLHGLTEFGQQAFPRGSYLVGHLEADKDPGHFFGKGFMKLQFDRIGLPSGDLPLDAKVIATRGYKVDREGDIRGKGHAKRDVAEWMLPPLWPEKLLMLPARGPRPALKGESSLTLRLMDDVQIPQVAQVSQQRSAPLGRGWHYFGEPRSESFPEPQFQGAKPQLATREIMPVADDQGVSIPPVSYASLVTRPGLELPSPVMANSEIMTRPAVASSGVPVFVLKSGTLLEVDRFGYRDGRITYSLDSGGGGVINTNEIDWAATTRLNNERGVHVTLHSGHNEQGASGL
jgi:hypothetical protein